VGSLDGGEPQTLIEVTSNAAFAPPGRLLFWRDGALRAQAFDPQRLVLGEQPVPVAPGTRFAVDLGIALFSATPEVLAYYTGADETSQSRLVLRDRQGVEVGTVGVAGNYYAPRFSRDGRRVAVDNSGLDNNGDIWIYDLGRPAGTRLTFDPADESRPIWSPGGDRIAFFSARGGAADVVGIPTTGRAEPEMLLGTPALESVWDWSRDGRYLAIESRATEGVQRDVWLLSLSDGASRALVDGPFDESEAQFSPDGRWLAYEADETGRYEVYVRTFPDGDGKWRVSVAGGSTPRWRADGRELFYLADDGRLMAVPVTAGPRFEVGTPVALFATRLRFEGGGHYDAAPDGQTFLLNEWIEEPAQRPMELVLGW
jgi:Tol biopolymer transport system component